MFTCHDKIMLYITLSDKKGANVEFKNVKEVKQITFPSTAGKYSHLVL